LAFDWREQLVFTYNKGLEKPDLKCNNCGKHNILVLGQRIFQE
jgi:hypothetical protein